jgi:energy-coupling factor transporter ATP-binding protein EcfA2/energy-coupling factor transporter transmembrane protein EcfT
VADRSEARLVARLEGAAYRYPEAGAPALGPLDLELRRGEMTLLCGPTGCGKSTLLRVLAGLAQRHGRGEVSGRVQTLGRDPAKLSGPERVSLLGFVAQEPHDQVLCGSTGDEIAFGPESAGMPPERVDARVAELLAELGLPDDPARASSALSGGQKQRLVVAAALAAGAPLLLLDEPLAHLDPVAAGELLLRLRSLSRAGESVLIVEHRVIPCLSVCDRVLCMDGGRIDWDGMPGAIPPRWQQRLGLRPGTGDWPGFPLQAAETGSRALARVHARAAAEPVLEAQDLRHSWDKRTPALEAVSLTLRRGERVALLGGNGAGKSTLLLALAGHLGARGLQSHGRIVDVPQDPDLALFCGTVRAEIGYGPQESGLGEAQVAGRVGAAARGLGVADLLDRPPQALSRGQRLRTAVAAALACRPDALLLDEPSAGQDREQVEAMLLALRTEMAHGLVVFATHDRALARRHSTRVIVLEAGRVLADGGPELAESGSLPPPPVDPAPEAKPSATRAQRERRSFLDPRSRLFLLFLAGTLALTLDRPASLALLATLCTLPLLLLPIGWRWRLRAALAAAALLWSTALSQGLFYADLPRVPLLRAGPLTLWREGVAHGAVQALRLLAVTFAGVALAASTPLDRLLLALLALRVPPGLAFLAVTGLRFVPDVGREALVVRRARARRGRPAWSRGPLDWLALEISLLRPVVARALRRARTLGESLDVRGFEPGAPRRVRRPLRMRPWEPPLLLLLAGVVVAAVAARLLYVAYVSEFVWFPGLRELYGFVRGWM